MALKTPLKLKNTPKKPKRMYQPLPLLKPLSSATPGAPTGNVERWLVTHKQSGGALSVVWDHYWFGARARAEWVHKMPRDQLELRHMPLLPIEQSKHLLNGLELAKALGMKMYAEPVVSRVDHEAGVITAEPRRCDMTFSYNDEPDKFLTCVLPSNHAGEHRAFTGLHCPEIGCRREAGHRGEHHGYKKRWKTSNGKKR